MERPWRLGGNSRTERPAAGNYSQRKYPRSHLIIAWAPAGISLPLQRFLDDGHGLVDESADIAGGRVGKQVGDPNKAAPAFAGVQNLHRGIVMGETTGSDDGPDEPACFIVDVDDELACHQTICERNNPCPVVEACVDKKPGS